MKAWRMFLHRLGYLPRQRRFDEQLDDELQFHIESRADELERQGYGRADARRRAVAAFGSRARVMEDSRAVWRFRWVDDLAADTRFALRTFCRRPALTVTIVGCLA